MFKLSGSVHFIGDTQSIGDKGFTKRQLVVFVENQQNPTYSDYVSFEAVQNNCAILDNLSVGTPVDVSFVVNGRKWTKDGKDSYFTTLKIMSIDMETKAGRKQSAAPDPHGQQTNLDRIMNTDFGDTQSSGSDGDDDLPF